MRSKSAIGMLLATAVLGCTTELPAGPAPVARGPAKGNGITPSDLGKMQPLPPAIPVVPGPVVPGQLFPGPAAMAPPETEAGIPAEALQFRAPVYSVADVLKQSDLGALPEEAAPPTDMIKRILPQRLSQAQAEKWLLKVPRDMVRFEAQDDAGSTGGISASSARKRGTDLLDERKWSRDRTSGGDRGWSKGDRGSSQGGWSKGGRGSSQGEWSDGERRHSGKRHSRWSRFGHGDRDLIVSSGFGWSDFAFGASFYFFPATIFSALHYFPYTFSNGFFYPAFCPFYFSAAFFTPYCQAPVVFYGTFGLVSGCPTCPISGRPLLWMPGEVPVL